MSKKNVIALELHVWCAKHGEAIEAEFEQSEVTLSIRVTPHCCKCEIERKEGK